MVVGTAGYQLVASLKQSVCKCLSVLYYIFAVGLEFRLQSLAQTYSLCSDNVHKGTALGSREHSLVYIP